jgi:hypothetical protein
MDLQGLYVLAFHLKSTKKLFINDSDMMTVQKRLPHVEIYPEIR